MGFFRLLLLIILPISPFAAAGDASIGETLSTPCVACHGEKGAEPISNYAILAGQNEKYLLYVLKSYKNGNRKNPIMAAQLAELTIDDLENLAAYFAAQESPLR